MLETYSPPLARSYTLNAVKHVLPIQHVIYPDRPLTDLVDLASLYSIGALSIDDLKKTRRRAEKENRVNWTYSAHSANHYAAALVTESLEWLFTPNPWTAARAVTLHARDAAAFVIHPERNLIAWRREGHWQEILTTILTHPEAHPDAVGNLLRLSPPGPVSRDNPPGEFTDPSLTLDDINSRRFAADCAYHVHQAWKNYHRDDHRIYDAIETARDETSTDDDLKTAHRYAATAVVDATDAIEGTTTHPQDVYAAKAAAGACLIDVKAAVTTARHNGLWGAYYSDLTSGGDGSTGYELELKYQEAKADQYIARALIENGEEWDPVSARPDLITQPARTPTQ